MSSSLAEITTHIFFETIQATKIETIRIGQGCWLQYMWVSWSITLFVLGNCSCEWYDFLTKTRVNITSWNIYIYIFQLGNPFTRHSNHTCMFAHTKTPLICRSYDLDIDWVMVSGIFRYSSVNVVFEIYYFPIFICDALVFMKICPVPSDANCFWSIEKPFFSTYGLL